MKTNRVYVLFIAVISTVLLFITGCTRVSSDKPAPSKTKAALTPAKDTDSPKTVVITDKTKKTPEAAPSKKVSDTADSKAVIAETKGKPGKGTESADKSLKNTASLGKKIDAEFKSENLGVDYYPKAKIVSSYKREVLYPGIPGRYKAFVTLRTSDDLEKVSEYYLKFFESPVVIPGENADAVTITTGELVTPDEDRALTVNLKRDREEEITEITISQIIE